MSQAPRASTIGLALTTAVATISSAALFILFAEPLASIWIAAGRVMVTALAFAVVSAGSVRRVLRACREDPVLARRLVAAALLLALHFAAWIASLSMTSVLRSVTLVTTQPLFAGLLGRFVGDRAPWRLYVGSIIAVGGTAVMIGGGDDQSEGALVGDMLALVGAVAAAAYFVVGRSVRTRVELRGWLVLLHATAGIVLLGFGLASGVPPWSVEADVSDVLAVVYLGLVPGVVGHGLLNWSVRHVPVHTVSLAVLLEPVGATLLAAAFAGRAIVPIEALGAAILLAGVAMGLGPIALERRRGPS